MRFTQLLPFLLTPALCLAQAQPSPRDNRIAELYDVGDLVDEAELVAPNVEIPRLGIGKDAKRLKPPSGSEAIARLLRAFVKPKLQANEQITAIGERWIVALGRPAQQAWIARFLAAARSEQAPPVLIECRCLSIPEITYLRQIRPALSKGNEQAESEETSYLTRILAPGDRTDTFLRFLEKTEGVTMLTAPRLMIMPLRIGQVSMINQTAYVRDFEVEVAKDAVIADPIIDVVEDGISLQAAISPLQSGKLGLSLEALVSELQRPIPEFKTKIGTQHEVTIQLPSLQKTQLEAAVEIQADHIVILAPPPMGGRRILFVVTVKPERAEAPKKKREKIYDR